MAFAPDVYTGKRLGKYQLLCRMAVGGMAEIFLAFTRSGPFAYQPVVVKRVLAEQRDDAQVLALFLDEAKVTAQLAHPNVARVLDLERDGDEVLLVIELISGVTVDELWHAFVPRKEQLPLGLVTALVRDCALGLAHAHGQKPTPIVHRDVTPKNLMLDFEGAGRVLDFGIARAVGGARRTAAGMVRGTAAYMSPEQATDQRVDPRTDVFSLGIILHELLTGQRLFHRGNSAKEMAAVYDASIPLPSVCNPRVSAALDAVAMKCLERPLGKRYGSAAEVAHALGLAAGGLLWHPERCQQLVRERFGKKRESLLRMLTRMSDDEDRSGPSTAPGRPRFTRSMTSTERTGPPRPDASALPTSSFDPLVFTRQTPTEPRRADDATVIGLPAPSREAQLPTVIAVEAPGPRATQPPSPYPDVAGPRDASIPRMPMPAPAPRRWVTPLLVTLALAVGIIGSVSVVRWLERPKATPNATPGVGRVSFQTAPPAQVFLEGTALGSTPIVDFYVGEGRQRFILVGPDGIKRVLPLDVKSNQVTKAEVKLDTLAPVP